MSPRKLKEKPEHHPKCNRRSFAVGYDMQRCGLCLVNAALELVQLRTKVGGYPTVPIDPAEWGETMTQAVTSVEGCSRCDVVESDHWGIAHPYER